VIVDIDLTGITIGAGAYLSFDLLGFGDRSSTIVIDNVLLTDGQPTAAPVAVNDSYSVDEGGTLLSTQHCSTTTRTSIPYRPICPWHWRLGRYTAPCLSTPTAASPMSTTAVRRSRLLYLSCERRDHPAEHGHSLDHDMPTRNLLDMSNNISPLRLIRSDQAAGRCSKAR